MERRNKKAKTQEPDKLYPREALDAVAFDSTKNYQWQPETEFGLTGKEFEILFNGIINFVRTPFSMDSIFKLLPVNNLIEEKFKKGRLDGTIVELTQDQIKKQLQEVDFEEVKDETPVKPADIPVEG